MATATAPQITMEAFRASREFLALTDKQRKWVVMVIETSDSGLATSKVYGSHSTQEYRSMLTRKLETSPRIIAALDLFYQRSPREKFIRDLQNTIRRSRGVAQVQAIALLAKTQGFIASTAADEIDAADDSPKQRVKVGDIVRDCSDGRKFRVTATDATGKATDGDPL